MVRFIRVAVVSVVQRNHGVAELALGVPVEVGRRPPQMQCQGRWPQCEKVIEYNSAPVQLDAMSGMIRMLARVRPLVVYDLKKASLDRLRSAA